MKFSPSVSKLLGFYLYNHIHGKLREHHYRLIPRHDLYGSEEPWEMWPRLQSGEQAGDAYAFTSLKKNAISGGRTSKRAARKVGKRDGGRWHGEDTGTKFDVVLKEGSKEEKWIGTRKRFTYKNNDLNFGEHMKWILHEFSLRRDGCRDEGTEVVCMIRNNGSPTGNAIADATKRSVLAEKKRKREEDVDRFLLGGSFITNSCSKRVCCPDPLATMECSVVPAAPIETMTMIPQQLDQQAALPSAETECFNPLATMEVNEPVEHAPLEMMMLPPPQQVYLPSAMVESSVPAASLAMMMEQQPQQQQQQDALPSALVEYSVPAATLAIEEQPQTQQDSLACATMEYSVLAYPMETTMMMLPQQLDQQAALPSTLLECYYASAPLPMMMLPQQQMQQDALPSVVNEYSYPATTPLPMTDQQQQQQQQQAYLTSDQIEWLFEEQPQQQQQQIALPSQVAEWSNAVAPPATMEQPQPVVEGGYENFSLFDIISNINFDIPENFEWGDLEGTLEANQTVAALVDEDRKRFFL